MLWHQKIFYRAEHRWVMGERPSKDSVEDLQMLSHLKISVRQLYFHVFYILTINDNQTSDWRTSRRTRTCPRPCARLPSPASSPRGCRSRAGPSMRSPPLCSQLLEY